MKKLDRIELVVSYQSKSLLFINYPHRNVYRKSNETVTYIHIYTPCLYLQIYETIPPFAPSSRLDFKEIPRRFRTEDYVARQTCLEWIHGRGKYRNLDISTPVCILIYSDARISRFLLTLSSRRGVQRYIQGCQVGQTKYRISDTMVADAASITPSPALPSSSLPLPARRLSS